MLLLADFFKFLTFNAFFYIFHYTTIHRRSDDWSHLIAMRPGQPVGVGSSHCRNLAFHHRPTPILAVTMSVTQSDSPTNQSDILPVKKPRAPKSAAARPRKGLDLELIQIRLSQIQGLDPEIAEFFMAENFNFETVTDFKIWSKDAARWSYQIAPMIVIKRKVGFEVLGSGRAWRVAQSVFETGDLVPALLLTDVKRIPTQVKFQIVAAELFGLCADFRTRPNLPSRLLDLWKQMNVKGVNSINGDDIKSFSRGTGYSLRALKSAKKTETPMNDSGQEIKKPILPEVVSTPAQPSATGSDT